MDAPTIEPCPTCGQRVHIEANGSYRQIAELQYRSAESQKHRLESFLVHLMDLTLLGKKRDYRSAMMDVHSRIYRRIGYQRWWIEHRQMDEDEEESNEESRGC